MTKSMAFSHNRFCAAGRGFLCRPPGIQGRPAGAVLPARQNNSRRKPFCLLLQAIKQTGAFHHGGCLHGASGLTLFRKIKKTFRSFDFFLTTNPILRLIGLSNFCCGSVFWSRPSKRQ
jgi:hypothetical protein